MLLIFGVRAALVLLATPVYTCERCGRHGQHRVDKRVRRLTLFFIPVLPVGRARYVDTCSQCGREIELSKAEAEQVAA